MSHIDKNKIKSNLLSLAGEYRVCSELLKCGIFSTVTYGTHKGVDVYAIRENQDRALRVEVKTSQTGRFVTGISQKKLKRTDPAAPDFWVLFLLKSTGNSYVERFFVFAHAELYDLQNSVNREYAEKYKARRGVDFEFGKGVDNVPLVKVDRPEHEDQWQKIVERFKRREK
jgi:hypothetical protein